MPVRGVILHREADTTGIKKRERMNTTRVSLLQQLRSTQNSIAWADFAQIYTPLVYHWVADLAIPAADRNDVVQDVFVVLLHKLPNFQYDVQGSFRAWLRTITIHKARDLIRKKHRKVEPKFFENLDAIQAHDSDRLTEQEYRRYVADAALKLMRQYFSETTWQACWKHVAEGRPAQEVADELGISINAVYLARGRVLHRLRQELQGLWD